MVRLINVDLTRRYQPPRENAGQDTVIENFEDTNLFLLSCFQYILVAVVFSVGYPYRKSLFSNGAFCSEDLTFTAPFLVGLVFMLGVTIMCTMWPIPFVLDTLQLLAIPASQRWLILGTAFLNFLISFLAENYGFRALMILIDSMSVKDGRRVKSNKIYKRIQATIER